MRDIGSQIDFINKSIGKLEKKKRQLQNSCSHEDYDVKYRGNTGNYDPSNDCYWADVSCNICGKRWHVDSEDPEYRRLKD